MLEDISSIRAVYFLHGPRIFPMSMPSLSEAQNRTADQQKIRTGRGWILAVAILNTLVGAFWTFAGTTVEEGSGKDALLMLGIASIVIGFIFLACWLWAKRSPFPAALTALLIYIALLAAEIIAEPSTAANGILLKLLFLIGLSSAVQSAYRLKQLQN